MYKCPTSNQYVSVEIPRRLSRRGPSRDRGDRGAHGAHGANSRTRAVAVRGTTAGSADGVI